MNTYLDSRQYTHPGTHLDTHLGTRSDNPLFDFSCLVENIPEEETYSPRKNKYSIQGVTANNNSIKGCADLSPFGEGEKEGTLLIRRDWYVMYRHLLHGLKIKILEELPLNITHKSEQYKIVQNRYFAQYNYRRDMELCSNEVSFVYIDIEELKLLLSEIYVSSDEKIYKNIIKRVEYKSWYLDLEQNIALYNNKCFVRGEILSAKNDNGKKMITSAAECLICLGKSKDVIKSLYDVRETPLLSGGGVSPLLREEAYLSQNSFVGATFLFRGDSSAIVPSPLTYIAVMPWNDKITISNEFRIFVLNGKIKAICQQKWYIYVGISKENILEMLDCLLDGCNKIVTQLGYTDATLDVWIDTCDTPADSLSNHGVRKVHLIEANPGGRWTCSSSLLFDWRDDSIWDEDSPIHIHYIEEPLEYSEVE